MKLASLAVLGLMTAAPAIAQTTPFEPVPAAPRPAPLRDGIPVQPPGLADGAAAPEEPVTTGSIGHRAPGAKRPADVIADPLRAPGRD